MKTAISLPDEIFLEADRLAHRLKKSRSELYRDAVAEYLVRHDLDAVTEAMDRVSAQIETKPDPFLSQAAARILWQTEW